MKTVAHHCEICPEDEKKRRDILKLFRRETQIDIQGFRLFNANPGS